MSSSTSSSSREDIAKFLRRITAFAAGLILLCAAVSVVVNSRWFDGTYITVQNYKLSQMAKHGRQELIIMGDSSAMAIDVTRPETQRMLGSRSAFNFALVNLGGIYPLYSTFKKYLEGGPAPDVVMLSFLPTLLSGQSDILNGSKFTKFYAAKFYSVRDLFSDDQLRARPKLIAQLLLEKYKLRFLQYRYDIARDDRMVGRLKATRGQMLVLENTMVTEQQTLASGQYRAAFSVSPASDAYFRRFLTLAEKHGTKVLLFRMPVPASVAQHRAAIGYDQAFHAYLAGLSRDFPGLSYMQSACALPNEYFSADATHLNKWGAEECQNKCWPAALEMATQLARRDSDLTKVSDAHHDAPLPADLRAGAISGAH
jgi:hypothetical protein